MTLTPRVKSCALFMNVAGALALTSAGLAQGTAGTVTRESELRGVIVQPTPSYRVVTNGMPCGQDQTEFMALGRLPEGLALLRMRSELEAAARLQSLPATNQLVRQAAPVASMQREVDSLVRVVRSVMLAAPRRGDVAESELAQRSAVTLRVRALAPQVEQAVELALARVARPRSTAPAGYMGVTVSSVPLRQSLQDGYIVSYCEYPLIVAIDPGSPAEQSGLQAGDTIVAFNGQDVRSGMVDYTALLTPNSTVRVRALRDGRTRDFSVRVGTRPSPTPVRVFARQAPSGARVARGEMSVASDSVRVVMFSRGDATFSGSVAMPPRAPAPPAPPALLSLFTNSDDAMLFGAQLKSLGSDLRAALSLPEGVLVLQVLRGTPAADAGLRDGDVIRAADGKQVRVVRDIRDAFDRVRAARLLTMRVVRSNEAERTIVMKW